MNVRNVTIVLLLSVALFSAGCSRSDERIAENLIDSTMKKLNVESSTEEIRQIVVEAVEEFKEETGNDCSAMIDDMVETIEKKLETCC